MHGWKKGVDRDRLELEFDPEDEPATSARRLLADWHRPPVARHAQLRSNSIQFYLGGAGAGAQPHWHGAAWNWLAHGRKRWLLSPPNEAVYSQQHVRPAVERLAASADAFAPLVCEQRAGDVLLVPETWGHATVNAEAWSVGWATEVLFDRTFDLGLSRAHGPEWWRELDAPPPTLGTAEVVPPRYAPFRGFPSPRGGPAGAQGQAAQAQGRGAGGGGHGGGGPAQQPRQGRAMTRSEKSEARWHDL